MQQRRVLPQQRSQQQRPPKARQSSGSRAVVARGVDRRPFVVNALWGKKASSSSSPSSNSSSQPQSQPQPQGAAPLTPFPSDYNAAVRQAQLATQAAVADGIPLIEVELPSLSLSSVAGDGEGQNEMNASMDLLKRTLSAAFPADRRGGVRVFFPDAQELAVARSGQTADPSAGRVRMDAKFEGE